MQPVAVVGLSVRSAAPGVVRGAVLVLGMIDRERLVEHGYILVAPHRHTICIEEPGHPALIPNEVVSPQLLVREHKPRRKHSLAEQQDSPVVLDYTFILLPQRLKRDNPIPLGVRVILMEHFIGQVANDSVNASVGDFFHSDEAINIVNSVQIHSSNIAGG